MTFVRNLGANVARNVSTTGRYSSSPLLARKTTKKEDGESSSEEVMKVSIFGGFSGFGETEEEKRLKQEGTKKFEESTLETCIDLSFLSFAYFIEKRRLEEEKAEQKRKVKEEKERFREEIKERKETKHGVKEETITGGEQNRFV